MIYYENEDLIIWAGYKFGGWRVLILNAEDGTIRKNWPANDELHAKIVAMTLTARARGEEWVDREFPVGRMDEYEAKKEEK